jgi:phosphatidylserine decarboxylase
LKKGISAKRATRIIFLLLIALLILAFLPIGQPAPVNYIERVSGKTKTEKIAGEKWLIWLYHNPIGEASLWALVRRKMVSSIYGEMMNNGSSVDKIQPFVEDFNIDLNIAQKQSFNSFNDFFTRKLKPEARPIDTNRSSFIAPADGKIMAWEDLSNADFIVKGYRFNTTSFLGDSVLGKLYANGSLMVIRLAPNDYHRFHFPTGGDISEITKVDGYYYSVNPIALREMVEIFCMNKREYVTLSTSDFGEIIMAEVGATMVGSIIQTYKGDRAIKGREKGYFEFGGSTVVLLFKKGSISIDQDLLINTANGLETYIIMGEKIGSAVE